MIARCVVTEEAARLTLRLEAYPVPDDFDVTGKYRQVITRVRDEYTNYRTLLQGLPGCPSDCAGRHVAGCSSLDVSVDTLDREARRLAACTLAAWHANRKQPETEILSRQAA